MHFNFLSILSIGEMHGYSNFLGKWLELFIGSGFFSRRQDSESLYTKIIDVLVQISIITFNFNSQSKEWSLFLAWNWQLKKRFEAHSLYNSSRIPNSESFRILHKCEGLNVEILHCDIALQTKHLSQSSKANSHYNRCTSSKTKETDDLHFRVCSMFLLPGCIQCWRAE